MKITVNKDGQGSVSPGSGVYPRGGTRTFTATPATGWRWDHWEGSLGGADSTDPSLDLPMDQARTITAVFIERATLTMVKNLIGNLPAEGGTVSPGEGEHEYDKGEEVELTATAASGWRFKQWSGGGASGDDSPITITMSGDKTVTATFIQRHTVTTASHTRGIVTPASGTWDHGQSVSFKWEKESNFCFCQFSHWAGLPESFTTTEWGTGTSDQETVSVPINDNYHLIAYDEPIFVTLTAGVDADGCTGCAVDPAIPTAYIRDTEATVTATPGAGWGFVRWDGDVPEEKKENNPLVMTMDEDKEVTAVMKEEFELTIEKIGQGTVDPDVGTYTYLDGETATLSATAADEWVFSHWSGLSETDYPDGPAGPGTSSAFPLNLVMHQDATAKAVFLANCDLALNEPEITFELPSLVQNASKVLEELGNTVFADFKFKLGGSRETSRGQCQNLDGTFGAASEKTGSVKLEFEKTDIPLIWGINSTAKIKLFSKVFKIKFSGGLRADVGVNIEGTYSVLEYECPCLDDEFCRSGLGVYSLKGGISGAIDIGNRLVFCTTNDGAQVIAELCNVSLVNASLTGMMGIEQTREGGCNPKDCIVAYIDPIRITVGVAIAGFNCTAIDWRIPEEEGAKLWDIFEGCENP